MKTAILANQYLLIETVQLFDLFDAHEKHRGGPDPRAGAVTLLLWISLWKMFIPTPIGLQVSAAWIKEINVLLVAARVGAHTEWKQMEVSQCCQGLWLHFDTWGDCRSLSSGWNLKYSEATLISFLWIGAPGPKGEKGMPGASREGSQGPRGRTGRVTTTSVYWSSKAIWWPAALRFKASSSWRSTVVGLDWPSHHSPAGSILDGSSLLRCKRLLQAASSLCYPFPWDDVF